VARFLLLLVLFSIIARLVWRFLEAVVRGASGTAPPGARPGGGPPASVKMSQCPVCGTYVVPGKAISMVRGGSPVYFDSEKCRAEYSSR
jgi:hypothetical protein